jgi:hypothetical protein
MQQGIQLLNFKMEFRFVESGIGQNPGLIALFTTSLDV